MAWSTDTDVVFLEGVYSGLYNVTPSHRAAVPRPWAAHLPDRPGMQHVGGALDMAAGVVLNRTWVNTPTCRGFIVQTTELAHAALGDLALLRLDVWRAESPLQPQPASPATDGWCAVPLAWNWAPGSSPDFTWQTLPGPGNATVWVGSTALPELTSIGRRCVAMAVPPGAPAQLLNISAADGATFRFTLNRDNASAVHAPAAGSNDLHECSNAASHALATTRAHAEAYAALPFPALLSAHKRVWDEWWRGQVFVQGNRTIDTAVRACLYYLFAAGNEASTGGVSPGGLTSNAYNGHVFWDQETWMLPALLPLRPAYAAAMLQYRVDRLPAAVGRSGQFGYSGAQFPWESAFTGVDCCPAPNIEGIFEQHISGDVAMAGRTVWHAAGSTQVLRDLGWPLARAVCDFWVCRMQAIASATYATLPASRPAVARGAGACGDKTTPFPQGGTGPTRFTIWDVQPPDESAGVVNDSAYTNAVAASSLRFCHAASEAMGVPADPAWNSLAADVYLPENATLFPPAPVLAEYTGYAGATINQADVALLSYPLAYPLPSSLAAANLEYYQGVTAADGYFTGDSAYSIAWLRLGNRSAADAQFKTAFLHIDTAHYSIFKERAFTGGHLNFLTGAGGFLQSVIAGYAGVAYTAPGTMEGISAPLLPPGGVSNVTLRSLALGACRVTLSFNASAMCFMAEADSAAPGSLLHAVADELGMGPGPGLLRSALDLQLQGAVPWPSACRGLQLTVPGDDAGQSLTPGQPICELAAAGWKVFLQA